MSLARLSCCALAFCLGSTALALEAQERLSQPLYSERDLTLSSSPGVAIVRHDGARLQRVVLRDGELLTTVVELNGGWLAAGVVPESSGTRLSMLRGTASMTARLAPPEPGSRSNLQLRPVLIADQKELEALAWLEGDDLQTLEIRAAFTDGDQWRSTELVGPRGKGSQTGLTGLALGDGSLLLVWAAYDGNDDELLWSRFAHGSWSEPRLVTPDNNAPDVTPSLLDTPDGALASWSSLIDGHYRILLSRFVDGEWSKPRVVGARGSFDPEFLVRQDQTLLLFQQAWPATWTLAEVDTTGTALRTASVAVGDPDRPAVRIDDDLTATFIWFRKRAIRGAWETRP